MATIWHAEAYLVTQLCPTLCDPEDCSPLGSSVHRDSPGKNTGVGCHALPQGIFSTQGSNPGLPDCRRILYCLSHQGSPRTLEWVAYPFSRGSSPPRNQTRVSCMAGGFFTSRATRAALPYGILQLNTSGEGSDLWGCLQNDGNDNNNNIYGFWSTCYMPDTMLSYPLCHPICAGEPYLSRKPQGAHTPRLCTLMRVGSAFHKVGSAGPPPPPP